ARPTAAIKALGQHPLVTVSGWMADIRTGYVRGSMFVAPLFTGSGQQNKILEAMAMGRPCITTPLVNNAIQATEDQHLLIAEDAKSFAAKIIWLHTHPDQRALFGHASRIWVDQHYSWEHSVKKLEDLLNSPAREKDVSEVERK
ncbi:MAG: glycosyltransferase, partial [Bacteroidota bacterium]